MGSSCVSPHAARHTKDALIAGGPVPRAPTLQENRNRSVASLPPSQGIDWLTPQGIVEIKVLNSRIMPPLAKLGTDAYRL